MARYVFELGYDLGVVPYLVGIKLYSLQWSLVASDEQLVSPAHSNLLAIDDHFVFRIYDISDPTAGFDNWQPFCLKVTFRQATEWAGEKAVSPLARSQIVTVAFSRSEQPSVAFGIASGWRADGVDGQIVNAGRFELGVELSLEHPKQPARTYRVDPEMVVGDGGTGSGARG